MPSTSRITVLVVEDEPLVRMDAVDIVEEAGFIAVEAANADEAIHILETNPDIRIVFTDIDMPGSMDGIKLAFAVRDRWPPVIIMIASGHRRPLAAEMPDRVRFFSKPYGHAAIRTALLEVA
ncbi:response regulator [Bosea sp. BE125]|uniref:response regulator n=1 Tax=Bosea sp. BE125 TaxID=2817909 RepID=UPI00286C728E|nr:response regulator [Bosea sp. BE125]